MASVCVVGAAGALGSACVDAALAAGLETRAALRTPRAGLFPEGAQLIACDARDSAALTRAAEGCKALLYCVNAPLAEWSARLPQLLSSAIEACQRSGARLVFPGNVWVYGPCARLELIDEWRPLTPSSRKGRLRAALEQQLAAAKLEYVIARLPEFYGPNVANPLMGAPFRAALAGRSIVWLGGELDVTVEYIFIRDAALAMVQLALAEAVERQTFHVPASAHTTPRTFFGQLQRCAGNDKGVRALPRFALRAAALASPPAREFLDILHLWTDPVLLDGARYHNRFGGIPGRSYADGLRETLSWFRAHPHATNSN